MSGGGEPVDLRAEHRPEWRDAGERVLRAYRAWCAATRSDRHERYVYLLDSLRREERAAWQVSRPKFMWTGGCRERRRRRG